MLNKTILGAVFIVEVCGPATCTAGDHFNQTPWEKISPIIGATSSLSNHILANDLSNYIPVALNPSEKYDEPPYLILIGLISAALAILLIISTVQKQFKSKPSIIDAWSIQVNTEKLFMGVNRRPNHDPTLDIFDGIRVLTAPWVFTEHLCRGLFIFASNGAYNEAKPELQFIRMWWHMIYYCVDPFYFMAGFLATFSLIPKLKAKAPSLRNYGSCIAHRAFRTLPSYAVNVMLLLIAPYFVPNSPLRSMVTNWANDCKQTWWRNVLLVDNLLNPEFDTKPYCAAHGWYVSSDMQLYLLAPIIVWIFLRSQKLGFGVILVLITGSCALRGYSSYSVFGWFFSRDQQLGWGMDIYVNPLMRMNPYLIGAAMGLLYYNYKSGDKYLQNLAQQLQSSKWMCWLWEFVEFGLLAMIIGLFMHLVREEPNYSGWVGTLFNVMNRVIFGMSLVCIVTPTLLGSKAFLKRVLSVSFWSPLSQLSYNFYLVHLPIIFLWMFGRDYTFNITPLTVLKETLQVGGISLICAVVVYFTVETHFIELERRNGAQMKKEIKQL